MHLSYTCVSPYSRRLTRHRHLLHADFRNTNEEQQRTNTEAESSLLRRLSPLVEKLKREVPGLFQNFQTGLRKEQRYMLCVQGISNDVKNTRETLLHQMGVGTMVTHARKIQLPAWVHAFHGLRGLRLDHRGSRGPVDGAKPPSSLPLSSRPTRTYTARARANLPSPTRGLTRGDRVYQSRSRPSCQRASPAEGSECQTAAQTPAKCCGRAGAGAGEAPALHRRLHALLPCEAHSSTANASTVAGRLLYHLPAHVRSTASPRRDRRGSTSLTKRHKPPVWRVRRLHVLMSALMPPTSPPPLTLLLDLGPHAFLHSLTWVLM